MIAARPDAKTTIRRATGDDVGAILELARSALGWQDDDRHRAFFRWKHEASPFGASPMWVAVEDDDVVGFRAFLRWEWCGPDGEVVHAVRAVDTATRPDRRRRGIFRMLTLAALDELEDEGAEFVFNTPNPRSGAGYLAMGWHVIGRPAVGIRPRRARSIVRILGARAPAARWSVPASFGITAESAFADGCTFPAGEGTGRPGTALATNRTPSYLRWRYGFGPLHYRVVGVGGALEDGFAVVRLRRRGRAVEAAVCELEVPNEDRRVVARLIDQIEGADYALVAGTHRRLVGSIPVPRFGPVLTWRALAGSRPPTLDRWHLTLGDLELL